MISVNGRVIFTDRAVSQERKSSIAIVKNPTQAQGVNPSSHRDTYGGSYVDSSDGDLTNTNGVVRKRKFEYSKVDLVALKKVYDNDSYCQVAINKYVDLIFKRGWYLGSKNAKAKAYIQKRLSIMSRATQTPFDVTLREIGHSLVLYANAYIKKVTDEIANAKRYTPVFKAQDEILVGLFTMHPASMYILRDKNNNIVKYQQRDISTARENRFGVHIMPDAPPKGGSWPVYDPEEVYHIHINREPGYAFGSSSVAACIEDIRALRMLEEHSARLLYRASFPVYHIRVGLPQAGFQGSEEEVNAMTETVSSMPFDGYLITNERTEVAVVGAEGEAMDPTPYLGYFENRTFTGLNVSPVQMGRDTSNRGTADALTTEMHDRAEAFQNRISLGAEFIFDTMLEEGGFDITEEENRVFLEWPEIELETMIKKEAGVINKWINSTSTADEMRRDLGLDSLSEDDKKSMFYNMVSKELLEAKTAVSAAGSQSKSVDNKVKPANQHGKRTGPKRKTEDVAHTSKVLVEHYIEGYTFDLCDIKLFYEQLRRIYSYINRRCCIESGLYLDPDSYDNSDIHKFVIASLQASNIFVANIIMCHDRDKELSYNHAIKTHLKDVAKRVLTKIAWFSILKSESSMLIHGNCDCSNDVAYYSEGLSDKLPPHSSSCTCELVTESAVVDEVGELSVSS